MRTVRSVGEVSLIARVRRRLRRTPSVQVGIGDDAAVLRHAGGGTRLVFASDMIVEGVHFRLPAPRNDARYNLASARQAGRARVSAQAIGWKALACNISDVAAMGGVPQWAVVSLGLPPATPVRFVDALYAGMTRCARRFGVAIVGGDTVRSPQVVVDVAILGTVRPRYLTLRRGARVGDVLFVTGRLGGSYRSGHHARFLPRLLEAQALVRRVRPHAMIDLSDGLAQDLWQMSRASGVILRVEATRIPVARAARSCPRRACGCRAWRLPAAPKGRAAAPHRAAQAGGRPGVYHALMDGEDFELLFAVGPRQAARVPRRIGACPITRIGAAVARGVGVELQASDGRVSRLVPRGFRHF